jgi:hypothetical protein
VVGGAPYERSLAVDVLGVGVGASSYERVAGLLATGNRGKVERGTLIPIPGINLGAGSVQRVQCVNEVDHESREWWA